MWAFVSFLIVCDGGRWWCGVVWCGVVWCGVVEGWRAGGYHTLHITLMVLTLLRSGLFVCRAESVSPELRVREWGPAVTSSLLSDTKVVSSPGLATKVKNISFLSSFYLQPERWAGMINLISSWAWNGRFNIPQWEMREITNISTRLFLLLTVEFLLPFHLLLINPKLTAQKENKLIR